MSLNTNEMDTNVPTPVQFLSSQFAPVRANMAAIGSNDVLSLETETQVTYALDWVKSKLVELNKLNSGLDQHVPLIPVKHAGSMHTHGKMLTTSCLALGPYCRSHLCSWDNNMRGDDIPQEIDHSDPFPHLGKEVIDSVLVKEYIEVIYGNDYIGRAELCHAYPKCRRSSLIHKRNFLEKKAFLANVGLIPNFKNVDENSNIESSSTTETMNELFVSDLSQPKIQVEKILKPIEQISAPVAENKTDCTDVNLFTEWASLHYSSDIEGLMNAMHDFQVCKHKSKH